MAENEIDELKRAILQLEFQHKKEVAEIRELQTKNQLQLNHTQSQLDHITKLTGIAFESLAFTDEKLTDAGEILSRKK